MFKKTIFGNGLRLLISPMENTRSVTVLILVKAGTKYETKKINGISHFLEHMCFKGTKKRPKTLDISKELDGVGGVFNAFTSKDWTGYFVKVDFQHFKLGIDVVSDIFLHSILNLKEIERERGVIIEEIKMIEDIPTKYIEDLWEKLLYKDQPAGWDIAGTRETISKIQREDLLNYIDNFYRAENTVIGIAGKIDPQKVTILVKKYFSDIKKGEWKKKPKVKELQRKPETLFFKKDTKQSHLALGVRAFNLFHKGRYALAVLATILGGNMSSRLFQELRGKRGLVYYVSTHIELNPDTGYLVTFTGVDHKNIEKATNLISKEYRKIKEEGPNKLEIERAKSYLKGRLRLSLEESQIVASFFAGQELLEERILTPEEKINEIEKVTSSQIRKIAKEIFQNKKLNFAVISPEKIKFKNLKI